MSEVPPYLAALPGPVGGLRRRLLRRLNRGAGGTAQVEVDGWTVILEPSVPDPRPVFGFSAPSFLGNYMDVRRGERVLDVSSGSGLVALHAAKRGAKVTAADNAPEALLCINRTFILAGFGIPDLREASPEALDLEDTFDVVTWTPPFLPGDDGDLVRRRQFRGDGTRIRAFLEGAPKLLVRGGRLLFPYPDLEASGWLHDALTDAGLRWTSLIHKKYSVVGPVRLYRAWVPADGENPGELVGGSSLPGAAWVLQDR